MVWGPLFLPSDPREDRGDAGRPATTMHLRHLALALALPLALCSLACDGGDATTPPGGAGPTVPAGDAPDTGTPTSPSDGAPVDAAAAVAPGGVSLDVANKCSDPVDYCLVHDGVEKHTRLNGSSHEAFDVGEGATVRRDDGGSCGEVVYTASAESSQSFVLCE